MKALVTGASSGIGLQYAHLLAKDQHADLLLVSNQKEELMRVAQQLHEQYGVLAQALYMDLSQPTAAQQIYDYCKENDWEIDVLINNAGFLLFGECTKMPIEKIELLLQLQVMTLTKLCRLFGADMAAREKMVEITGYKPMRGYILNMSSMTCWMPMPTIACYNASKAYIINLSKALWYELYDRQVNVCAVTPGAVDTPLYKIPNNMRPWLVRLHISITPERLASKALRALFRGKKWVMPGRINRLFVPIMKHLPDWMVHVALRQVRPYIH